MSYKNLINIALLQIQPNKNLDDNLSKGIQYCEMAKEMGADIVIFPEMWSNGYDIYDCSFDEWKEDAIDKDSDFINAFKTSANKLEIAICVTYLEKHKDNPKNSLILFDRYGNEVLNYSKVHTCDFGVEKYLTSGEDFYVNTLNTKKGNIEVGAMICYDREFPESARVLMLKGAELILVPNACPMEINRISQLRGRAYENMLAIATCNYPDSVPDCNGNSTVFDGVAYLPSLSGSRDTCLVQATEEEGIFIAQLDIEQLRNYRQQEVHGNAYRKVSKYNILLSKDIKEPFIRKDFRK